MFAEFEEDEDDYDEVEEVRPPLYTTTQPNRAICCL
jgi:hypothetical protein